MNPHNEEYYETYNGNPYIYDNWKLFFKDMARIIVNKYDPITAIDVGCAKGFLVHELNKIGTYTKGIDGSKYAIDNAHEPIRHLVSVHNIEEDVSNLGKYGIAICIEVMEHVEDPEAGVRNLCKLSDRVIFSSTSWDLDEPTHVSVKTQEEWREMFADNGMKCIEHGGAIVIPPWSMYFERK